MKQYIAGATVVAMMFLGACSGDSGVVEEEAKVRPAKLAIATRSETSRSVSFPAVINAIESAELTFQIPGEITELNVLEGQIVSRGDVIARLNQRDGQNQVARAQAEFDNAEAEYRRAERLSEQDAISGTVLDSRRTARDVAAVALDSARKSLADTVLRAPFDGSISRVSARRFQNVQAKESIATIQTQEVEAVVNMPGTIISRIPQLNPVGVTVRLSTAPEQAIQGEFREFAGTADPETQTYQVSFSFTPPDEFLVLPGMTATVDTELDFSAATDILPDGVAVPLSAILVEGGQTYVWTVDPDTYKITKTKVEVGVDAGEAATIVDGLQGGEIVIAAGVTFFNDGMTVRPWQAR